MTTVSLSSISSFSSCTSLGSIASLSSQSSYNKKDGTFTMVFLDFDDTLIPTTLRQWLYKPLGIDIFKLLSSTQHKKLQYTIIKAIDTIIQHIYKQYHEYDHKIKFCIVSNANQSWLDYMFNPQTILSNDRSFKNSRLSLLSKLYFYTF